MGGLRHNHWGGVRGVPLSRAGPVVAFCGGSPALAAAGMENTGTAALSLLDGQHAIVTFWTAEVAGQVGQSLAFRCVTFFDEDLVETGETCDQAVYLRQ